LVAQNFMSRGAADTAQANVESLQAVVNADRAAVDAAKVPVSYGQVRAAVSGRLGGIPVFVGSVVKVNDTSLGTIVQTDVVDVAFSVPQDSLPALLARLNKAEVPEVDIVLAQAGKTVTGKLTFVDNAVDAATGTVKVKARVNNAQAQLWPGQFVRARLQTLHLDSAVLVPAQALVQNPKGTAVFVVREGKANVQPVKVLALQADMAAVSGLEPGSKVVVDGRQNVRPNAPVSEIKPGADKPGAEKKS
jgi:RND family efflux transporter MFP subunit